MFEDPRLTWTLDQICQSKQPPRQAHIFSALTFHCFFNSISQYIPTSARLTLALYWSTTRPPVVSRPCRFIVIIKHNQHLLPHHSSCLCNHLIFWQRSRPPTSHLLQSTFLLIHLFIPYLSIRNPSAFCLLIHHYILIEWTSRSTPLFSLPFHAHLSPWWYRSRHTLQGLFCAVLSSTVM
jgi:hypothetical protein